MATFVAIKPLLAAQGPQPAAPEPLGPTALCLAAQPLGRPRRRTCAFFRPRLLPPFFRYSFAFRVLDLFVPYCVPCQFPCGSGGRERRWQLLWWRRLVRWPVRSTSAAAADRRRRRQQWWGGQRGGGGTASAPTSSSRGRQLQPSLLPHLQGPASGERRARELRRAL